VPDALADIPLLLPRSRLAARSHRPLLAACALVALSGCTFWLHFRSFLGLMQSFRFLRYLPLGLGCFGSGISYALFLVCIIEAYSPPMPWEAQASSLL
jgi:hypothetical protein